MANAERIEVETAHRKVAEGDALLVCAYEDEGKCREMSLEGSITLSELESRNVDEDREIVFYCA